MSSRLLYASIVIAVIGGVLLGVFHSTETSAAESSSHEMVERGKYLVTIGGCHDCHTPKVFTEKGPELDASRLLSGHPEGLTLPELEVSRLTPDNWVLLNNQLTAAAGPWGISYTANITSDKETGIGRWTEAAFIETMRTGLHWGAGPPLLPPMPWMNLAQAKDEDLKAIFAYLQSTKPVKNRVPAPVPIEEIGQ